MARKITRTLKPPSRALPVAAADADASRQGGYRLRGLQGKLIKAIGSAIVNGKYRPGEYLPVDRELCKRYRASRPTIREVIRVLEAKGLVQTRQKKGTCINSSTLWNIIDPDVLAWLSADSLNDELLRDLTELRQIIEPAAARLAAGRATLADIRSIQNAHSAMRSSVKNLASYAQADAAFHTTVFAASHNALLTNLSHVVSGLLRLSFELSQQTLNDTDNTIEQDLAEHESVMAAISLGDGNAAESAMLRVVLNGKAALVRRSEP